jgi:hypothetical protein
VSRPALRPTKPSIQWVLFQVVDAKATVLIDSVTMDLMQTVRKMLEGCSNVSRTMKAHRMFEEKPEKLLFVIEARCVTNVIL